jgi:hypothetical protein
VRNETPEQREKRLANLKNFQQTASPEKKKAVKAKAAETYKKNKAFSEILKSRLTEVDKRSGRTQGEIIADRLVNSAKTGSLKAIEMILERLEGKAKTNITLTYDRKTQLEIAIEKLMNDAEQEGNPISRLQAIEHLKPFLPEVSQLQLEA